MTPKANSKDEILPTESVPMVMAQAQRDQLMAMVLDAVDHPGTRRNYRSSLCEFLDWWEALGKPMMTKALVQQYKDVLQERELAASSINVKLAAVRKLAIEAANCGLVEPLHADGIRTIEGVKAEAKRARNWLTNQQAQALLNAPDPTTTKGLRDRAILAVLLLAGLCREELANLNFGHIQMRDNRWVLVGIVGRCGRTRSVPIVDGLKTVLDDWAMAAEIRHGFVFRSMRRGDHVEGKRFTNDAVWQIVTGYARQVGLNNVTPQVLRRTYAKLAHKGGAALEQISFNLGHGSISTTEAYLGADLDLQNAPSDHIDLQLDVPPWRHDKGQE